MRIGLRSGPPGDPPWDHDLADRQQADHRDREHCLEL